MEVSDEERLTNVIVREFKRHWRKILRDLENGKPSLAETCYGCFEADTVQRQRYLANRFYGLKHVTRMAELSDAEIQEHLSTYLPAAIQYVREEFDYDAKVQEKAIKELVANEYVIIQSPINRASSHPDNQDWKGWSVVTYPAPVPYGDWYERTFGSALFVCGEFILLKSTGEPFTEKEIEWSEKAIVSNIKGYDHGETKWQYSLCVYDPTKVTIYFSEIFDEADDIE